jgi:hypothetical protein
MHKPFLLEMQLIMVETTHKKQKTKKEPKKPKKHKKTKTNKKQKNHVFQTSLNMARSK